MAQIEITGTVISDKNKPIEFCSIYIQNNDEGTYTNDKGYFKLTLADTNNLIVISHIGYETKKISFTKIMRSPTIQLIEKETNIQEIVVLSSPKTKYFNIGNYKKHENHYYSTRRGRILAYFFDDENIKNKEITTVFFRVAAKKKYESYVRLRFYSFNDQTQLPDKEITEKEQIILILANKKLIKAKLNNPVIIPKNGIVVGIEILGKHAQNLDFSECSKTEPTLIMTTKILKNNTFVSYQGREWQKYNLTNSKNIPQNLKIGLTIAQ
jgi:hypothetical protein